MAETSQDLEMRSDGAIDAITFEVLRNAFKSVVDEMSAVIQTVGFSLVVSEGRDYSGTICTADGDLVSSGSTDQTSHLGTIPYTVKGMLEWIQADPMEYFEDGDLMIVNDAFIGGTHNNDVRIVMPVFVEGEIIAFVQVSAHWPDIGGHVPGTFDPNASSAHGEGLAITPLKFVRAGRLDQDITRMILRNVRTPEIAYGDLMAQVGACRLGARRLRELCERYSRRIVLTEMRQLISYSESLLRAEFARLPDSQVSWTALIDRDPGSDSDQQVPVTLDLTIEGDRAVYDFSRSAPQARGAINGTRAVCASAAIVATKAIFPHVPMNQGVFNVIDLKLPPRLVISAEYPAPISGMAATAFPSITDAVVGSYLQIIPERSMAGSAGLVNIVIGGSDERPEASGDEYVMYLWLEGGWGGRPGRRDNNTSMNIYGSGARNQPIELQERLFPIIYHEYRYETDSAGAGRHRGGVGVRKTWEMLCDATLSELGDRSKAGPFGFDGGKPARPNSFKYDYQGESEREVGMFCTGFKVEAGKRLSLYHSGGGGWADSASRPPEWVLEDVTAGLVSVEAARSEYKVAVIGDPPSGYRLDEAETRQLRQEEEVKGG